MGCADLVGWILSCKNRRYLEIDVHFAWQDIFMLFECLLCNRVGTYFLQYVQPLVGKSNDPVPVPFQFGAHVNEATMPFFSVAFFSMLYFGLCGYLHCVYYMPYGNEYVQENKVQKDKKFVWSEASRAQAGASELDLQLFYKAVSTATKAILSLASISCYPLAVMRGETNVYWSYSQRGPLETISWFALAYFAVDASGYWIHRALHWQFLYKHVHKLHHIWKSPSPWVVVALHPAEFLMLTVATQSVLCMIPLPFPLYVFLLVWIFFYNTMDHSGVEFPSIMFWQAPVNFHDRHHQYFHVNYAPMVDWWDRAFGSYYYEGVTKGGEDNFHDHWEHMPGILRSLSQSFARCRKPSVLEARSAEVKQELASADELR